MLTNSIGLTESIGGICLILGFLSGLITGWNLRERKAYNDAKRQRMTIEEQMVKDGFVITDSGNDFEVWSKR